MEICRNTFTSRIFNELDVSTYSQKLRPATTPIMEIQTIGAAIHLSIIMKMIQATSASATPIKIFHQEAAISAITFCPI